MIKPGQGGKLIPPTLRGKVILVAVIVGAIVALALVFGPAEFLQFLRDVGEVRPAPTVDAGGG